MPTRTTTPASYRIIRHREPRGEWFEVEGMNATGARWIVATCDDRHEARETVRQLERHEAHQAAAATLTAARDAAAEFQVYRRTVSARLDGAAWARLRDFSQSLVADRRAIAHAIRSARSAVKNFSSPA